MANVYGIANLGLISQEPFISGDVACPAGTTTILCSTSPLIGTNPSGFYIPWVFVNFAFLLGATPPTALSVSVNIGAGAQFNGVAVPVQLLVANAFVVCCYSMLGSPSQTPWQGAGSVINVRATSTGQAVTCKAGGLGYADVLLFRAPDQ